MMTVFLEPVSRKKTLSTMHSTLIHINLLLVIFNLIILLSLNGKTSTYLSTSYVLRDIFAVLHVLTFLLTPILSSQTLSITGFSFFLTLANL